MVVWGVCGGGRWSQGSRLHQEIGTVWVKDTGTTDAEKQAITRREKVKDMMRSAWKGYVDFGFGENELMPKAKKGTLSHVPR